MNILTIDTRDNQRVYAKLEKGGEEFTVTSNSENRRPESILKLIDIVCKKAEITIYDIDDIFVEEGPGSYTGLKVGASVANALSFALLKKVNGKEVGEIVEPKY
jgi:tRNA threonylcarbamoyladenosine biosynthesis protein TsaB